MEQLEIKKIQDAITRIFEKKNVNGDFAILDHAILELKEQREKNKILDKALNMACEDLEKNDKLLSKQLDYVPLDKQEHKDYYINKAKEESENSND